MNRRSRRNRRNISDPDPGLVHYMGPTAPRNDDSFVVTLYDNLAVDTDSSGNISAFISNNPSAARNWTEYSTSWITYRVLAVVARYAPKGNVNTTSLGGFDGYHSVLHSPTVTAPTTMAGASSTGIARIWTAFKPWTSTWRMESSQEATFQLTSSPQATSQSFLLFALAGGTSVHYGNIEIQYLVQFKTHAL